MREVAQQVYVVTARWGGRYSAFTASSVTSISLKPPLIMVSVDRSSLSHDPLVNSEYFAVTLLSFDDVELAKVMAEPVDPRVKLEKVGFREEFEAPLLSIPRPYLLLRRYAVYDGGDHSIVLGEVVGGGVSGVDCPLLYRRRSYTTIAGCQG
jgi:flavin reductase (DIM6/NTAB) family NADH-FMN oxidoreductase RutF